uniref:VWFA domain-containing protein n=1 Tax=Panagrolaimus sp. ES5 TaxID=591445 RepID=A0AC34FD29_9BILA
MGILLFILFIYVSFTTATSLQNSDSLLSNLPEKIINVASICDTSSSSAITGQISSPNYPNVYPDNLHCVFYIYASHWLYDLELIIPVVHTEAQNTHDGNHYDWLTIEYRKNGGSWQTYIQYLDGYHSDLYHAFSNSDDIKMFLVKLAAQYAFLDDKTTQNPYSSRFGVIEFSDTATVSVPLDDYTRFDFISQVSKSVGYGNGGESNVTIALQLAYAEFIRHGVANNASSLSIILVVNDISMFHFKQTLDAMATLKTIVQLPMGIIVPGLPGVPVNAKEHLTTLLGNANYAFDTLDAAIPGVPRLTSSTFSCSACSGIIFICEATAAIGYDHKLNFLQLVQRLATHTERSSKQLYAIALYGAQIYQHITLQNFNDFNQTLTALIENVIENNLPEGGNTYLAPILNELYTTLTTNLSSSNFATLIMGQVTAIKDPSPANSAASKIAALSPDIYVLDETHYLYPTVWHTLTQNKPNHIVNGSLSSNFDDVFSALTPTLLKDFSNMKC